MATTTSNNLTDFGEAATAAYWESITLYAALMTVAGGETQGGGTEVSAADYARVPVVWSRSGGTTTNSSGAWLFGTPATDWGTAVEMRLFDAETGGNDWFYYSLGSGVVMEAGAPVRVPVNGISQTAM